MQTASRGERRAAQGLTEESSGDAAGDGTRTLRAMRERVVNSLREEIIEGRLRANDRLVEREIAEQFGVSRMPVREAIRQLTFEGFLVALSPRKIVVRELTRRDVEDLYDVREALEWLTVGLVVRHATEEDIRGLREIVSRAEKAKDEGTRHRLNNNFHEGLSRAARNPILIDLLKPIEGRMRWLLQQNADFGPLQNEHSALMELVEARDLEGARSLAVDHVRHSRSDAMLSLFPGDDLLCNDEREFS